MISKQHLFMASMYCKEKAIYTFQINEKEDWIHYYFISTQQTEIGLSMRDYYFHFLATRYR